MQQDNLVLLFIRITTGDVAKFCSRPGMSSRHKNPRRYAEISFLATSPEMVSLSEVQMSVCQRIICAGEYRCGEVRQLRGDVLS